MAIVAPSTVYCHNCGILVANGLHPENQGCHVDTSLWSEEDFQHAVEQLANAADLVSDTFHESGDPGPGYPSCLPDFDEFVRQLHRWKDELADEAKRKKERIMEAKRTRERDTALAVCELIDTYGIHASWEFPGYLSVKVPGGHDLAYGTASGVDWCGHYETDEDGRVPPGWEPDALPLNATAEQIVAVLVDGYRRQISSVAARLHADLVDMRPIADREHMETSYGRGYHLVQDAARALSMLLSTTTKGG